MTESVELKPLTHYNKNYKEPSCSRTYFDSDFSSYRPDDVCTQTINDKPCGAPRWCHPIDTNELLKPETEWTPIVKSKYCRKSQKYLENNFKRLRLDDYIINGLCTRCLSKGICCFFDDHPSDSPLPVAPIDYTPQDTTLKFNLTNSTLSFTYSDDLITYFQNRYQSNYTSSIFVRHCYKEMYQILDTNGIITGVPGIGKSAFLHYILYRHINSPSSREKPFALSLYRDVFIIFEFVSHDEENGTAYRTHQTLDPSRYSQKMHFTVFDFESVLQNEFFLQSKKTWYLSSPNPSRYKFFGKTNFKFYMPTWSLEELRAAFPSSNLELYRFVGGVPRNLLFKSETSKNYSKFKSDILEMIDSAINEKCSDLMSNYTTSVNMQMQDSLMTYKLISLNPSKDRGSTRLNYRTPVYDFASQYIYSKLYEKYKKDFINLHLAVFKNDVVDFAKLNNISKLFEKAFLYLCPPAQNKQHTLDLIMEHTDKRSKTFSYSSDIFFFNSNFTDFEMDIFYAPMNENYESVDGFCLKSEPTGTTSRPTPNNVLYLFQVTTAKRHPVKLNGLKVVRDHYIARGYTINEYRLVFVLPKGSHIKEQEIESNLPPPPPPATNSQSNSVSATSTVTAADASDAAFVSQIIQYKWTIDFNPEDLKLLEENTQVYFSDPSQLLGNNEKLAKRKQSFGNNSSNETVKKSNQRNIE